tara:strand:+ start:1060 stop:1419 length:360 start_codon:yes stop_codon:yes gene_type:complete
MKIKNQQGFTLIEILVAIGLLALIMGISMQILTANSKTLITLEEKVLSQFVAENIMVSSYLFEEELLNATGNVKQGNKEFLWKREIISQDNKSVQIKVKVFDSENKRKLYELNSFRVLN